MPQFYVFYIQYIHILHQFFQQSLLPSWLLDCLFREVDMVFWREWNSFY